MPEKNAARRRRRNPTDHPHFAGYLFEEPGPDHVDTAGAAEVLGTNASTVAAARSQVRGRIGRLRWWKVVPTDSVAYLLSDVEALRDADRRLTDRRFSSAKSEG
jgi:hypothetical protein